MYFNGAGGLFGALGYVRNPEEWRLFIDLPKVSLKAVRLHNGNIYPPVPLPYSVHTKGSHEGMRTLPICIDYDKCRWKICRYLEVLGLLLQFVQSNAHSLIKIIMTQQIQCNLMF